LIRFIKEEQEEKVKEHFLQCLQGEFIFLKLCREDKTQEFRKYYCKGFAPTAVDPNLSGLIELLRQQAKRLLSALQDEILSEDGYYHNAVEAMKAIKEMAGRDDKEIRKFLCESLKHFELQGQTFVESAEEFEAAIDPRGFLERPCEGKNCIIKPGESLHCPERSIYYYLKNNNDYYKKLEGTCRFNLSTPIHLASSFYENNCLEKGKYTYYKPSPDILNKPSPFDFDEFLNKTDSRPLLNETTIKHLLKYKEINYIKDHIIFYDELIDLPDQTFITVYQKRPNLQDIKSLLPKPDPERRLVMEILDAMRVLAVGDVTTQEFLFTMLGKEKSDFHWHEKTRIRMIEVIADITRGETLPGHNGQQAVYVLGLIEARDETKDVEDAVRKAREKISNRNESGGGEMMLAPDWPEEGVPI